MKRLIVAYALTVITVALCITGYCVVKVQMEKYEDKIKIIEETSPQDFDTYYRAAQEYEEEFHSNETLLAFFVNHEKLDELKFSIAKMRAYSENKNHSYLLVECAESQMIIRDIIDDQTFCIHSIF